MDSNSLSEFHFLKGPIKWAWVCGAARLGGKCLHVAIALQMTKAVTEKNPFKVQGKWVRELPPVSAKMSRELNHSKGGEIKG